MPRFRVAYYERQSRLVEFEVDAESEDDADAVIVAAMNEPGMPDLPEPVGVWSWCFEEYDFVDINEVEES
jgi:hypothetical protein